MTDEGAADMVVEGGDQEDGEQGAGGARRAAAPDQPLTGGRISLVASGALLAFVIALICLTKARILYEDSLRAWVSLLIDAVKALAWPIVFIVALVMFRKPIADKLPGLQRLVLPGGAEAAWAARAEEAEALSQEIASRAATRGPGEVVADQTAQDSRAPSSKSDSARDETLNADKRMSPAAGPTTGATPSCGDNLERQETPGSPDRTVLDDPKSLLLFLKYYKDVGKHPMFAKDMYKAEYEPAEAFRLSYERMHRYLRAAGHVWSVVGHFPQVLPMRGPEETAVSMISGSGDPVSEMELKRLYRLLKGSMTQIRRGDLDGVTVESAQSLIHSCEEITYQVRGSLLSRLRHPSRIPFWEELEGVILDSEGALRPPYSEVGYTAPHALSLGR